jgi:CMP-N,N'-diacetyllegionaminic acid synthase
MKILGLIPARGGSKGIPGKNIKILGNKPLISWVIKDGLDASKLDQIIVSTDSLQIGDTAKEFGAQVPFIRPEKLAMDQSPSIDVVIHAINFYEEQGVFFDAVCLLQPTSPFKPNGFIDSCVDKFEQSGADSLISVLEVPHEYNPHWTFKMDSEGDLSIATGESELIPRRQELPKAFHRDGSVYLAKVSLIKEKKVLVGGKTVGMASDKAYYANLDTMKDWHEAELTYKRLFECAE